jgi:hypothetical protein
MYSPSSVSKWMKRKGEIGSWAPDQVDGHNPRTLSVNALSGCASGSPRLSPLIKAILSKGTEKMSDTARDVRSRLYRSKDFRSKAVGCLNLGTDRVSSPTDALLEAGSIPCDLSDNEAALAADGTKMLLAIASQVRKASAIASVAERIENMTLQFENGKPKRAADPFGAAVAKVMRATWQAANHPSPSAIPVVGVGVWWSDPKGNLLYGMIDDCTKGRPRKKQLYASGPLDLPSAPGGGDWDYVQLPTVGGSLFTPLPLMGFFDLFSSGVDDTAASLQTPSRSVPATHRRCQRRCNDHQ